MKKLILAVAFVLMASSVKADIGPYALHGWLDIATGDAGPSLYLAGWGFECQSGTGIARLDVWYEGDDGWFHPVYGWVYYTSLYRPDVFAAYFDVCGQLTTYKGFGVQYFMKIPPGRRRIAVNMWFAYDDPHYIQFIREVDFR